jgi:putative ABC transport system permease protein
MSVGTAHRLRRRSSRAALSGIGLAPSRLRIADAVGDALLAVSRAPLRTVLSSMGTVLAVGTAVATIGLSESAAGAVSGSFNALLATEVVFVNSGFHGPVPADLTEAAERRLAHLNGVMKAGLEWQIGGQSGAFQVSRTAQDTESDHRLPVTAASADGLAVIGAKVSAGRLFDAGMDRRRDLVALLGANAAQLLGITGIGESPVIYISGTAFTVIGIVNRAPTDPGALTGAIIPDTAATVVGGGSGGTDNRQITVRTSPGAAQLIGRQGPYAIDPLHPGKVSADVPVDPARLRESVSSSLTSLLLAVALIALAVGVIAIANTTLLSVLQRRAEIGLRRSVGAAPRHIAALVLSEASLIGAAGGVIGTSIGVLVISAVCASRGWIPVLAPGLLAAAPVTGLSAGLLAGLYPAWRASRISPIEALQR